MPVKTTSLFKDNLVMSLYRYTYSWPKRMFHSNFKVVYTDYYNLRHLIDPAVVLVQFDRVLYDVEEGQQVFLTAVLSAEAERDLMVDFSTFDGTARGTVICILCTCFYNSVIESFV